MKVSIFGKNSGSLWPSDAASISDAALRMVLLQLARDRLSSYADIVARSCVDQKLQPAKIEKPPLAASRPLRVKVEHAANIPPASEADRFRPNVSCKNKDVAGCLGCVVVDVLFVN